MSEFDQQVANLIELAQQQPSLAAEQAEALIQPRLSSLQSDSDWLLLCCIADNRILTLSDFHSFDNLIQAFDEYGACISALSAELRDRVFVSVFGMLVFRQPGHKDINEFEQRCENIVRSPGDAYARLTAANYLVLYRIWKGNLLGAEALRCEMVTLREKATDVRTLLLSYSIGSMIRRLFLDYSGCMEDVQSGLDLARSSGIHHWDSHFFMQCAFLSLSRNSVESARDWLEKMSEASLPEHYLDRSGYHYCMAWCCCLEGQHAMSKMHAEESIKLATLSGAIFPQAVTQMGLAQLHLDMGNPARAVLFISKARKIGKAIESQYVPFARGLSRAHLLYRLGLKARARAILSTTFELGREQNYVNFPWWRNQVMSDLSAFALEENIETDYVRRLINVRQLRPPASINYPEQWQWIMTMSLLDEPKLEVNGEAQELSGKGMEILQMLAASPEGKPVSRSRIIDMLWPDVEGDKAQRSLDTAVHRLRKQLKNDDLIIRTTGALALDTGLCSVDYWWLSRWLHQGDLTPENMQHLAQVMQALPSEDFTDTRCDIPVQRLWRHYYSKLIEYAERNISKDNDVEFWLQDALDRDPAHERLWQALIKFYLNRGLYHDAQRALASCEQALKQAGGEPSLYTRQLNVAHL